MRKALKMNQAEMGKKINVSQAHISALEKGIKSVTDRIISDYCREFNVSEQWLHTGQGEMFIENDETIIAELATEYNLDDFDKTFITHYLQLDSTERKTIKEYVLTLATQLNKIDETAASTEDEIEKELDIYRKELMAGKKAQTLSASQKQDII